MRRTWTTTTTITIAAAAAAGCATTSPTAAAASPPATASSSSSAQPGSDTCQLTADGGHYFLTISSAAAHNFTACTSGVPVPGGLDAVFASGPGVDRRCASTSVQVAQDQALVAVYSSTRAADEAAARAYCTSHGMTG